jgi:hypothetical protein
MKRKQVTLIVIIAAFAAVILLYLIRTTVYAGLNNLDLIPQPERFTELYFEDASNLPRMTVAKQPIEFAFTIHNLEGVTTTYPYSVYLKYPFANNDVLVSSTITLADNATTTIPIQYVFPATNEQVEVVVDLTSLNQSIDFLMPDTN